MTDDDRPDGARTMFSALRPSLSQVSAQWANLVWSFQDQARRLNDENEPGIDSSLGAPTSSFQPGASKSEELDYLLSLALRDDDWMDIGAGAGRLAVPLSRVVRNVVAVDTSPTMRDVLRSEARAGGMTLDVRSSRWPDAAAELPPVDVTLAANMFYANDRPVAFIEAMEQQARRLCVVALADRAPRTPDPEAWAELHGEPLVILPGAREFITLLNALGRRFTTQTFPSAPPHRSPLEAAVQRGCWRYGVRRDSPKLGKLREIFARRFSVADDQVIVPEGRSFTAVISWEPQPAR